MSTARHIIFLLGTAIWLSARAAVPGGIEYQAYLTDTDGAPVDATVSVTLNLYDVEIGGNLLWTEAQTIIVDQGLLSTTLGNPLNPFPVDLFDGPVFLSVTIEGETLTPRRALTSTAYSFKAADADTLTGESAAALDQSVPVSDLQGDVAVLQSGVNDNDARLTTLESTDITAVAAGSGLGGGGSSGVVTLEIAAGSIDATMLGAAAVNTTAIADGAVSATDLGGQAVTQDKIAVNAVNTFHIQNGQVMSEDLADGSVFPEKLVPGSVYEVGGLRISGLSLDSDGNLIWRDELNNTLALFGYNDAGFIINDSARSRVALASNDNGISIGSTLAPPAGFELLLPPSHVNGPLRAAGSIVATGDVDAGNHLNVGIHINAGGDVSADRDVIANRDLVAAGTVFAGRVQISTVFEVNVALTCENGLPCFSGTGEANCPAGTMVLGGGTRGGTPHQNFVVKSHPTISGSSWLCSVASKNFATTATCYAICARIQ